MLSQQDSHIVLSVHLRTASSFLWPQNYSECIFISEKRGVSDRLLSSVSLFGLFPDSCGTVVPLVEQHIGLTGLQLVL